jgi:hypothetical protein
MVADGGTSGVTAIGRIETQIARQTDRDQSLVRTGAIAG